MSYRIGFTSDAKSAWRQLDVAVQEAVLDTVDQLASNLRLLRRCRAFFDFVYDFTCDSRKLRHYIFLTIRLNHSTQEMIVAQLGQSQRRI